MAEDHIDPDLLFAGTEFGIYFSINGGGLWATTSSPTNTQKASYETSEKEFKDVYSRMKEIYNSDIKDIENQLEIIKAPWTPGRFPDWE